MVAGFIFRVAVGVRLGFLEERMVRKHRMSLLLLSIRLQTAPVSGSDTGPVPQVKSWQSLGAPIPGVQETTEKASWSQFRTDGG